MQIVLLGDDLHEMSYFLEKKKKKNKKNISKCHLLKFIQHSKH